MSDTYLAVVLWHDASKLYGCLADLSGTSYLFKDDSLARDFQPTPSTIVSFRIDFLEHSASARNGYSIILVEPADLQSVTDDDLETLTRAYATHCEKESNKRLLQKRERQDDYGQRKCRKLIQQRYQIRPLKNRWNEE